MKTSRSELREKGMIVVGIAMLFAVTQMAYTQPVISVKGGLVNAVEGKAEYHSGRDLRMQKLEPFLQLRRGDEVQVRPNGRVELLLNPGSFARLGAETQMRLVNEQLSSLVLELRSGSMVIEAGNIKSIGRIEVQLGGHSFFIVKDGIYRFDVETLGSAQARVFRGEMQTTDAKGKTVSMKKSRAVSLVLSKGTLAFTHFDIHQTDSLDEWSAYRAGLLERANVGVLRAYRNGYPITGYYGYGLLGGGWFYNPFYGTYTFLPGSFSYFRSPYGFYYYPSYGGYGGSYVPSRREGFSGSTHREGFQSGLGGGSFSEHRGGSAAGFAPSHSSGSGRSEGGSGGHRESVSVRKQ